MDNTRFLHAEEPARPHGQIPPMALLPPPLARSSRPLLLTSPPFSSDCFDCVSLGADVAGGVAPRLVKRVYSCVCCVITRTAGHSAAVCLYSAVRSVQDC